MKKLLFLIIFIVSGLENNSAMSAGNKGEIPCEEGDRIGRYAHMTTNDFVHHIVKQPAFNGFGSYLLPWDDNSHYLDTPLKDVGSLLPYHSHVDPGIIVGAINHMIDEISDGKTIFYDFYTDRQKQEDSSKKYTGLFFFKGKPGAPFAVVCPGGGFAYVGSLHEGFPLAKVLKGLPIRGGSVQGAENDIANWLRKLGEIE